MIFEGEQLQDILMRQSEPVQIRDRFGHTEIEYQRASAAIGILQRGKYIGTGNKKRIWFLQAESSEDQVTPWGAQLDFRPPKGACAKIVDKNRTSLGAKKWKPRPDRIGTGRVGKVVQRQVGPAT
jgi:hypothetical protein